MHHHVLPKVKIIKRGCQLSGSKEVPRLTCVSDGAVGSVPCLRGKHHAWHLSGCLNIYERTASDDATRDTQLFVPRNVPFSKLTHSETERKACFLRHPARRPLRLCPGELCLRALFERPSETRPLSGPSCVHEATLECTGKKTGGRVCSLYFGPQNSSFTPFPILHNPVEMNVGGGGRKALKLLRDLSQKPPASRIPGICCYIEEGRSGGRHTGLFPPFTPGVKTMPRRKKHTKLDWTQIAQDKRAGSSLES